MVTCALLLTAVLSGQTLPASAPELLHALRWCVLVERWDDAIQAAREFESRYPGSPLVTEARYLRHKAQLFRLLERSANDPGLRSAAPLIKELHALRREPLDDAVAASKLALGTLQYLVSPTRQPETLVSEALRDWRGLDRARARPRFRSPHEDDVLAIRNLVFQPYGGGVFAGDSRWSDVRWAPRAARYLFVNPRIRVRQGEHGSASVFVYESFPNHPNVIFMDDERRTLVDRIIQRLGTLKKRSWMKPGKPLDIFTLWTKASFGYRGRAGGWIFYDPPRIASIEFLDPGRTRAIVEVALGYSGGTIWLEKRDDAWVATGVRNFWAAAYAVPAPLPLFMPVSTSISSTSLRMRCTCRAITSCSPSTTSPQRFLTISAAASTEVRALRNSCPSCLMRCVSSSLSTRTA